MLAGRFGRGVLLGEDNSGCICYLSETSPPPPLLKEQIFAYDHPNWPVMDIRLLGNFPFSQVAGCSCILLGRNFSISLARSEEQINFSQQSPKMLKMASETFIHALLLFLGLFLKISRCVPLNILL